MFHEYYGFIFFTAAFKEIGYFINKNNKHNIFTVERMEVPNCMNDLRDFLKTIKPVIKTG